MLLQKVRDHLKVALEINPAYPEALMALTPSEREALRNRGYVVSNGEMAYVALKNATWQNLKNNRPVPIELQTLKETLENPPPVHPDPVVTARKLFANTLKWNKDTKQQICRHFPGILTLRQKGFWVQHHKQKGFYLLEIQGALWTEIRHGKRHDWITLTQALQHHPTPETPTAIQTLLQNPWLLLNLTAEATHQQNHKEAHLNRHMRHMPPLFDLLEWDCLDEINHELSKHHLKLNPTPHGLRVQHLQKTQPKETQPKETQPKETQPKETQPKITHQHLWTHPQQVS